MNIPSFERAKKTEVGRLELQARTFEQSTVKQISLLKIESGSDVLDAGCGTGCFARKVSIIVRPAIVRAVDIDPTFIEVARELSSYSSSSTNIEFKVGDIYNLEYPDGRLRCGILQIGACTSGRSWQGSLRISTGYEKRRTSGLA